MHMLSWLDLVGTSSLSHQICESETTTPVPIRWGRTLSAPRLKAIEKSHWNLISACDDAKVIILNCLARDRQDAQSPLWHTPSGTWSWIWPPSIAR